MLRSDCWISWLRTNSFLLTLLGLSFAGVALAGKARGDVQGIPWNARFATASFPYPRQIKNCEGWRMQGVGFGLGQILSAANAAGFAQACRQHDLCFHRMGSSFTQCNQTFVGSLRRVCRGSMAGKVVPESSLAEFRQSQGASSAKDGTGEDVRSLAECWRAAEQLLARVRSDDARMRYLFAQEQATLYLDYVTNIIDDIYKETWHRSASAREKSQGLDGLRQGFDLTELRSALMGAKVDVGHSHQVRAKSLRPMA